MLRKLPFSIYLNHVFLSSHVFWLNGSYLCCWLAHDVTMVFTFPILASLACRAKSSPSTSRQTFFPHPPTNSCSAKPKLTQHLNTTVTCRVRRCLLLLLHFLVFSLMSSGWSIFFFSNMKILWLLTHHRAVASLFCLQCFRFCSSQSASSNSMVCIPSVW